MNKLFYHVTKVFDDKFIKVRWHSISKDSFLLLNNSLKFVPITNLFDCSTILNTKKDTSFYTEKRFVCDVMFPFESLQNINYFQIICNNECSIKYYFNNIENKDEFNFFALTDLQCKFNPFTKQLMNILNDKYKNKSFVVCSGDLTDCGGSEEEWTHILDNNLFDDTFLFSAVGDHEYWADDTIHPYPMYNMAYTYNQIFNNPINGVIKNTNYYFTYGNSLFVFLDSGDSNNAKGINFDLQAKWFKDVIIPIRNKYTHLFILMHKSIYGSKIIDSAVRKYLTNIFEPLFIEAKATLVLSGHDHIYSRTNKINGVTYLDMGSSGDKRRNIDDSFKDLIYAKVIDLKLENYSCAANIKVCKNKVIVEVINTNLEIVDKFEI